MEDEYGDSVRHAQQWLFGNVTIEAYVNRNQQAPNYSMLERRDILASFNAEGRHGCEYGL